MTKARQLADLLDGSGDVKSTALANVPPSDDASALTTGTLPDGRFPAILPAVSGENLTGISAFSSGMLLPTATLSAPSGWLMANGEAVSRATYADLFTAIGSTYGAGDGSTTFNLPDLRGRTIAGKDDMGGTSAERLTSQSGGVDGDTLGAIGGAETHQLTVAQMPSHTHNQYTPLSEGTVRYGTYRVNNQSGSTTVGTRPTGGDAAHNNVQPTIILNYIIKT